MSQGNQTELHGDVTSTTHETGDTTGAEVSKPQYAANDAGSDPAGAIFEELNQLSANNRLEELEQEMQSASYVAGDLALKGQITLWFAGPNTGKTLLALKLISDAQRDNEDDLQVYHLNLDDDQRGVINKAALGDRCGFRVIDLGVMTAPTRHFTELVEKLIEAKNAGRAVFVLDTIKKFTDVMDKGSSSKFMTLCRRFTVAGGTIIGLAHANKHEDAEGRPIPGGTGDLLDDSDCAYVMHIEREEALAGGVRRYVKFDQRKARGPVAREASYSYEVNDDGDYSRMFYSVKPANAGEVEKLERQDQIKREQQGDQELIDAVKEILSLKPSNQTILIDKVRSKTGKSKHQVRNCLQRWSCAPDDGGIWVKTKGDNNATIYSLQGTP